MDRISSFTLTNPVVLLPNLRKKVSLRKECVNAFFQRAFQTFTLILKLFKNINVLIDFN